VVNSFVGNKRKKQTLVCVVNNIAKQKNRYVWSTVFYSLSLSLTHTHIHKTKKKSVQKRISARAHTHIPDCTATSSTFVKYGKPLWTQENTFYIGKCYLPAIRGVWETIMNIEKYYLHRQILFTCIPDCTATSSKFVDKMSVADKMCLKSVPVYICVIF